MGAVVWSPLAQGLLTGRVRKGQQTDLRRTAIFSHMRDERRLDAVEKIIPLAAEAGLPMTHLAMAFAIAHPAVTSALIGPRTMRLRGTAVRYASVGAGFRGLCGPRTGTDQPTDGGGKGHGRGRWER
jgi:aryl-alcohol dehydrogenase-like predicted oxidoreductase